MSQKAKPIDLSRSYVPLDPNMLTETMHATEAEDAPETRNPVIPYEGYNFMPTPYGYRSYFGLHAEMEIGSLPNPDKCRDIFNFQKLNLSNILIALCDDGIWTKSGESTGDWVREIELSEPDVGTTLEWSKCIIENKLYIYRQGNDVVYVLDSPNYVFAEEEITGLNMSGQLGIFKAGSRLGFWDSDNSVAWSAFEDKLNVTPNIGTGANITKFNDVIGKIILILQHGSGFIIYATKSIVGVQKDPNNNFLWQSHSISNVAGISYRNQVAMGSPDTSHFCWSSIGLQKIENFQSTIVAPELFDYLKEAQSPIYLKFIEGRYLFVQLVDAQYVNGQVTFYTQTIDPQTFFLSEVEDAVIQIPDFNIFPVWEDPELLRQVWTAFNLFPGHVKNILDDGGCADMSTYCPGVDYGVYKDHIFIPLVPGDDASILDSDPVRNSLGMTVNGRTIYFLADESPLYTQITPVPADPFPKQLDDLLVVDNEQNFYSKVTGLWDKYNSFVDRYIAQLDREFARYPDGQSTEISTASVNTLIPAALATNGAGTGITAVVGAMPANDEPLNPSALNEVNISFNRDFWCEYERLGELFYVIARPQSYVNYNLAISSLRSEYKYPMRINLSHFTGIFSQAVTDLGNWQNVDTIGELVPLLNTFIDVQSTTDGITYPHFDANGLCLAQNVNELEGILTVLTDSVIYGSGTISFAPSGSPSWYYNNLAGIQSSVSSAGLSVSTVSVGGAPAALYGDRITLTYHDTAPQDFSFLIQITASGLESADEVVFNRSFVDNVDDLCDANIWVSYSYPDSYIRYLVGGGSEVSPNTPPAIQMLDLGPLGEIPLAAADNICSLHPEGYENRPVFLKMAMQIEALTWATPFHFDIEDHTFTITILGSQEFFTIPGISFLMQSGAPVPSDISWVGAYVYDSHLKKWGKMKADYRQLLDFSPINSSALGIIPFTQFGVQGAVLDDDGNITLFDTQPEEAYIKYGKIGLFRMGDTALEEIRGDFRQACTGQLEIETSIDGRSVEVGLTDTRDYSDTNQVSEGFDNIGKWHNITFRGQFDLSYLEFRSWIASRR